MIQFIMRYDNTLCMNYVSRHFMVKWCKIFATKQVHAIFDSPMNPPQQIINEHCLMLPTMSCVRHAT